MLHAHPPSAYREQLGVTEGSNSDKGAPKTYGTIGKCPIRSRVAAPHLERWGGRPAHCVAERQGQHELARKSIAARAHRNSSRATPSFRHDAPKGGQLWTPIRGQTSTPMTIISFWIAYPARKRPPWQNLSPLKKRKPAFASSSAADLTLQDRLVSELRPAGV